MIGTTITSFRNDDGLQVCFVVAIEGYEYLITDYATPADLFVVGGGWEAEGWSSAIGGLLLEGVTFGQSIVPWDNKIKGNDIAFSVMDYDGTDRFGIDVFKNGAGDETELTGTGIDNNDTTINVKDTTNFSGSGSLYIGTEQITYGGKTGTSFTDCTRGKYSPFVSSTSAMLGRNHGVTKQKDTVPITVKVSNVPRNWIGRWVGIYCHRVVGGKVDMRVNAILLHAGKIVGVQDSSSGNTVVSTGSVLGAIQNATFFDNQWMGRVKRGIYIGTDFWLKLEVGTLTSGTPSVEVSYDETFDSTTSGLTEGSYYEIGEFLDIFNEWLLGHTTAIPPTFPPAYHARLTTEWGEMKFVLSQIDYPSGIHKLRHKLTGRRLYMQMLGYAEEGPGLTVIASKNSAFEIEPNNMIPDYEPIIIRAFQGATGDGTLELEHASGKWVNNEEFLPVFISENLTLTGGNWGVIQVGDTLAVGKYVSDTEIASCRTMPEISKTLGLPFGNLLEAGFGDVRYSEGGNIDVKQVVMLEGGLKHLMTRLLATTGVGGLNHATYDEGTTWGEQMGAAIPWSLLGNEFENTLDGLFMSDNRTLVVLDGPTSFEKIFLPDMTLRGAYMIFKGGKVQFTAPQSPAAVLSVHTLTESNKAVPSGNSDLNRTPTQITGSFIRNIFKVSYNRSFKDPGKYSETKTFKYKTSIDDYGERKAITVKARNTYSGTSSGDGTTDLATYVVSCLLPTWGKPLQRLRRTIDMEFYFGVGPGDICTITDNFARNSLTGTRGIAAKPAMILSHSFGISGGMMGEVDLLVMPFDNVTAYCPVAYLDETATNSGYVAGTKTLTLRAHEYSTDGEVTDSTHFEDDDEITIEEISPSNPASTTSWDRVISSVGTNTIVLTVALSSPAFDTAKQYQVFSRVYGSATDTQKNDTYQADDGDSRIVNTRDPYHYANAIESTAFTATSSQTLPEKHSNSWFGDGAPLTVANHSNIGRMSNNLIGYKTAPKGSVMFPNGTPITGTDQDGWQLNQIIPIYVGVGAQSSSGGRLITISPFMKTSSAGQLVSVRVTISRLPPNCDPSAVPTLLNHEFAIPYHQLTFSTVSASYSAITAQSMPLTYNTGTGLTYLSIETKGSGSASPVYWGLSRCEIGAPV